MQIHSITSSPSIPMQKTSSAPVGKAAADQAVLNFSPDSFSSLVKEAGQIPEVRSEVVEAFKSRIQAGNYPTQDAIAGLTDLIGGGVVKLARSGSSSE